MPSFRRFASALIGGAFIVSAAVLPAVAAGPRITLPTDAAVDAADGHLVVISRVGGRAHFDRVTAPKGQGRATASRLVAGRGVVAVVPDQPISLEGWPADGAPNDTYYGQYQADLGQIGVPEVWSTTRGSGTTVAILDTGALLAHPDLAGVHVVGTYNALDRTSNVLDGNGHGTHTLGTVAAQTNNSLGVAGIAPDVDVLVVKVLSDAGSGSFGAMADGIEWAIAHGADVISMSLGASGDPAGFAPFQFATDDAYAAGVTVVASSGNGGNTTPHFPSGYPHVISVGSVNAANAKSSFTQYGPTLDVMAPGESIASTYLSNWYSMLSGTSMATPHVTGAIALIQSVVPGITPDELELALESTALDIGDAGRDDLTGYGTIHVGRALIAATGGTPVPPKPTPSPTPTPSPSQGPDTTRPTVVAKSPVGAQASATAVKAITLRYSENIILAPTITVTSATPGLASKTITGSVSYNPSTFTFTFVPSLTLPDGPTYTVKVGAAKDAAGNASAASSFAFSGPLDVTAPAVVTKSPTGYGVDLATVRPTVVYAEPLGDAGAGAKVVVTSAAPGLLGKTIMGSTRYDPATRSLTFTPSAALPDGPQYTVSVTGVRDLSGNLAANLSWTFGGTWDATPPVVTATSPTGYGTTLAGVKPVITFSEPLGDAGRTAKVTLVSAAPGLRSVTYLGTTAYEPGSRTLTFTPASSLPDGPLYTVTVTGARDLAGNPAATATFTFGGTNDTTTPVATAVAPSGAGIALPAVVAPSIAFSEPLGDAGKTAAFTVVGRRTGFADLPIAGSVTYADATNTLTFTPKAALPYGPVYSVTVSGARDRAGNLATPSTWTFQGPVDVTAPTVTGFTPTGSGVAPGTAATITFSEDIAPSTAVVAVLAGAQGTTPATPTKGALTYDSVAHRLTWRPATIDLPGRTYAITVSGVRDASGNLAATRTWTWDGPPPDVTAPSVTSTSPTGTASTSKPVASVLLSERIVAGATVTVTVRTAAGVTGTVAGKTTLSTDGRTLSFTPTYAFTGGSTVTCTVAGAKDPSGNVMGATSWSFRTP